MSEDVLRLPHDPLPTGAVLRLYSMRMCPYAQRARLMLAAKKVKYDLVNVDLNNKPDWFFDINFYGEVPVIIRNGKNVFESLICCEYLEEVFPDPRLYSPDPHQRAMERIYFNHWTKKGIPAFYSLLKAGCLDTDQADRLDLNVGKMEEFLVALHKPYYSGDQPGFADYMIWPWFERMHMLEQITGYKMSGEKFPKVTAWVEWMWQDPVVQECRIDPQLFLTHYSKYRTGKPDFTIRASNETSEPVQEALENLDGLRDPSTRDRQGESLGGGGERGGGGDTEGLKDPSTRDRWGGK
ncbi:glutathione S-transferase omega-1-like [Babylonia areolata]|uniref:glutathione S-transferase omega-1-like n=1 Tax=Babylonia areolata TaxID=304850 RepID=UPI003FD0C2FF